MRVDSSGKKSADVRTAADHVAAGKLGGVFAGLFGALLGLALLKFGNPIILERQVEQPGNFWEWLLNPWPVAIGYGLLAVVALVGLAAVRRKTVAPKALLILPLVWLGWEMVSATQSEVPSMSWHIIIHFSTCLICFYLGLFSLSPVKKLWPFWIGLLAGFFIVLAFGFEQHFGGLEESRRYWMLYVYPTEKDVPLSLWKKMQTNRIFSTLFYPNTLAGVILLLLPPSLAVFWSSRERFTVGARRLLMGLASAAALACLFWSGSKGGWLLMLVTAFVAALFLPIQRRIKSLLVAAVLVLGLAGFFIKYAGYFKKGATSVEARRDYWQAALRTVDAKPVFGSGPGTFGKAYARVKRPESEMSLMVHNDYLQQASDSGIPGSLAYTAFIVGMLAYLRRKGGLERDWIKLAVWLGVLGWALQNLVEFGLYIPALAWPAFAFMGWMLGVTGTVDESSPPRLEGRKR